MSTRTDGIQTPWIRVLFDWPAVRLGETLLRMNCSNAAAKHDSKSYDDDGDVEATTWPLLRFTNLDE
jgi:hypothetical protein